MRPFKICEKSEMTFFGEIAFLTLIGFCELNRIETQIKLLKMHEND